MPDDGPIPEPTEQDERRALEFVRIRENTGLRGVPEGEQRCGNCHFFADESQNLSYCWHDELEIIVGAAWWCDRWAAIGAPDQQMTEEQVAASEQLWHAKVEDNRWVTQPRSGRQCSTCLYYLDPDGSVSYCWHPGLQVGVGRDHWCSHHEQTSGA
jgi:hypothetical protein